MGPHATERVSPVRGGRGRIRSPSRDPWDEVSGGGLVGPTGAVPRPEMLACVWRAAVRCKAQGAGAVIGGRGGRHRRRADRVSVDCGGDAWLGRLCVPTCCLRAPDARLGWGKSVGAGLGLLDDTRAAQKGRAGVLRTGRVARDVGAFVSRRVVCAHLMRALDGADVSVPDCGFAKVRVRPRWGGGFLRTGRVVRDVGVLVSRRAACVHLMRALDGADLSVSGLGIGTAAVSSRRGWAGVLRRGRVARDVGAFVSRRVVCAHQMRALGRLSGGMLDGEKRVVLGSFTVRAWTARWRDRRAGKRVNRRAGTLAGGVLCW